MLHALGVGAISESKKGGEKGTEAVGGKEGKGTKAVRNRQETEAEREQKLQDRDRCCGGRGQTKSWKT